jgi:5-methylcytosine-specific restriction protein B
VGSYTGRSSRRDLSPEDTLALYVRIHDATHLGSTADEDKLPAPESTEDDDAVSYWFAGAVWSSTGDQTPRFLAEGIWENGYDDQFSDLVRRMKPGDRIAIKASFVQKRGLPFDVGEKPVSAMRIKATGTVLANENDGKRVKVAWDPLFPCSRLVLLHVSYDTRGSHTRREKTPSVSWTSRFAALPRTMPGF